MPASILFRLCLQGDSTKRSPPFLFRILSPIASYKRDPKTNQRPAILDRLHCGLRATTKFLEKRIKESQLSTTDSSFAAIFVCRREIQPPHLCEHLLRMACLARVKVVSLPQGSEPKLAASCGLKTLSAVGMVVGEGEGILRDDLEKINDVQAPWLSAASYKPTKVKVIETTAPLTKPNKRKADNPPQEPPSKKAK